MVPSSGQSCGSRPALICCADGCGEQLQLGSTYRRLCQLLPGAIAVCEMDITCDTGSAECTLISSSRLMSLATLRLAGCSEDVCSRQQRGHDMHYALQNISWFVPGTQMWFRFDQLEAASVHQHSATTYVKQDIGVTHQDPRLHLIVSAIADSSIAARSHGIDRRTEGSHRLRDGMLCLPDVAMPCATV